MLFRSSLLAVCVTVLSSCTSLQSSALVESERPQFKRVAALAGAWEVTAVRARGVGKNLLTFSSDGTFFRSGDSHPVLSGGHGAWKQVGPNLYQASYVAFSFDSTGKWIGVNRNNLQIELGEDRNAFKGTVKSSNRDLQEKEVGSGTSPLEGKRIQVQPF